MSMIISASKSHCHSRLSKPILKIASIGVFQENNFPKQYALNTFSDCFYKKLPDEFYRKTPMRESLF